MAPAAISSSIASVDVELDRIEEALDQADVASREGRIEAVDRLRQHGVTEAVDDVRELGDDRRIDRRVEAVRHEEDVDVGLDLAGEFLEHEMLVLHLGAELGGLEQALAVPYQGGNLLRGGGQSVNVAREPLVDEGEVVGGEDRFLGVPDQPVVLGMEDMMDGGEADILVHAAVAGDEVGVEQLVVVLGVAVAGIGETDRDVAVGDLADGHRLVGDVGEEGVAGADGACRRGDRPGRQACPKRRRRQPCWECRRGRRR